MSAPRPAGWNVAPPRAAGIGLRGAHHRDWLEGRAQAGWLEAHAENFFAAGGALPAILDRLRRDHPLALHGVGLSLGGCEPLDQAHLRHWRRLVDRHDPCVISEHLCWGTADGMHFNDLLPMPFTEEALRHLAARVRQFQDASGRRVLIENVASYVRFAESALEEWDFLTALVADTDCGLLLDVNNVYVNACNHGFEAERFLRALPSAAIGEIHLAGHETLVERTGSVRIDTHDRPVCEAVWNLYRRTVQLHGAKPTLIEWDAALPAIAVLEAEAARADAIVAEVSAELARAQGEIHV